MRGVRPEIMKSQRKKNVSQRRGLHLWVAAAVLAVVCLCAGQPAAAADYEKRWDKNLGEYFKPRIMVAGDFMDDPGDEVMVIDTLGFAYFLQWKNNKLEYAWITSAKVASEGVVAAAAADLDRCGEDEVGLIDANGRLILMGSSIKKFKAVCKDCLPKAYKSFKGEFIAPAQADGDTGREFLIIGKWDGEPTALIAESKGNGAGVRKTSPLHLPEGEVMSLWPATVDSADRFYVHLYSAGKGDMVVPLWLDEEGVKTGAAVSLAPSKLSVRNVFAADVNADGANEIFVMGTALSGGQGEPGLTWFTPDSPSLFQPMEVPLPYMSFMAGADLNDNGWDELVFMDFAGNAAVASKATPSFKVNGQRVSGNNILKARNSWPYIPAPAMADPAAEKFFKVKKYKNLTSIRYGDRILHIDTDEKTTFLRVIGDDEPRKAKIRMFKNNDTWFFSVSNMSKHLKFKYEWDVLKQTLNLDL